MKSFLNAILIFFLSLPFISNGQETIVKEITSFNEAEATLFELYNTNKTLIDDFGDLNSISTEKKDSFFLLCKQITALALEAETNYIIFYNELDSSEKIVAKHKWILNRFTTSQTFLKNLGLEEISQSEMEKSWFYMVANAEIQKMWNNLEKTRLAIDKRMRSSVASAWEGREDRATRDSFQEKSSLSEDENTDIAMIEMKADLYELAYKVTIGIMSNPFEERKAQKEAEKEYEEAVNKMFNKEMQGEKK